MENTIYKLKWVSLCEDENGFNFLKVRLVERFVNWKYDKFISLKEWEKLLQGAVIDPDKKNIVLSKNEKKLQKKLQDKQQAVKLLESKLVNSILADM